MKSAADQKAEARDFGVHDWITPRWSAPDNVRAFVTTRRGGVSTGAYASLNLSDGRALPGQHDDPEAVLENRRRLYAHLPAAPRWLAQVHGNAVVRCDRLESAGDPPRADAAVATDQGVVLAVLTADCLPVFLAAGNGRAVGVVHAGWRGLAAGVLENGVHAMGVAPDALCAWLGPAIGPEAFEVGPDVYHAFVPADAGAASCFRATRPGKWHTDLYELARRRLVNAGLTSIAGGGFCTYKDVDRFYSYRRDGATGRMAAVIWIS